MNPRASLMKWPPLFGMAALLLLPMSSAPQPGPRAASPSLQLTVSLAESAIAEPFPARVTLHFHNSGSKALWLYHPVRDAAAMFMGEVNSTSNGSLIAAHLQLTAAGNASGAPGAALPGVGTVLRSAEFPDPGLVSIPGRGDYAEPVAIQLKPARIRTSGGERPLWGGYELSVAYTATFAEAQALRRDAGVDLWTGSISSNAIPLSLAPAPDSARGVISGSVADKETRPDAGILVSISDWNERLITQQVTAADGEFYIDGLPFGRYWVTVRPAGADVNTGFFEHAEVTAARPEARLHLVTLQEDVYQAKQMLHKPVFFRIRDAAGDPQPGAELEILWDDGTVLSNVKIKADDAGLAEAGLIPGSNYVTVRKHGCDKKETVANIPEGNGVAVFPLTIDCK